MTNHYKEREPQETIEIIKDFFNQYIIKEVSLDQSEIGTWYCRVELYKNNFYIIGANGKGVTKDYALASGYAELYERFCNKTSFIANPCWVRAFMETNKKRNGYYFSPEERELTYEEILSIPRVDDYFSKLSDFNKELTHEAIDLITDSTYIGVPMKNIDGSEPLYMDPRLLRRIERTNGMCAGNTLNEALVQGCSEIMERLVSNSIMYNMDNITYYALNIDNIKIPNIQDIINNIKNLGYELYIFDFSYNYQLPVLMSLLVDRNIGLIRINFGSFPVFDIAVERILTELYQGIKSMKDIDVTLQLPYKNFTKDDILEIYKTSISGRLIPNIFDNITYIDNYNTNVFVNENNNNALVDYYKNLTNIKFYYLDNSLDKRMYALHIFAVSNHLHLPMYYCDFTKDDTEIDLCFNSIRILRQTYKNIYENKSVDLSEYINFIYSYQENFNLMRFLHGILLWNGIFLSERPFCSDFDILFPLVYLEDYNLYAITTDITNSELYLSYKKYLQLLSYVKTNKYTLKELIFIFNHILNYNITNEDILKCTTSAYLIQKVYIEPFYQYMQTNDFKEIINIYISGGYDG